VGTFDYPKTEKAYNNRGDKLVRARRAGMIPFEVIRDDSASVLDHLHFDDAEHFYAHVHELGRNFTLDDSGTPRHGHPPTSALADRTPTVQRNTAEQIGP
jgi:hypothetical protein